ncbi:MAG: Sialate O-acetylesterase [Fibrobacteres bacterium]|nr:Sialate O-acetylesterase [Fibrobacterota bacterium]
MKRNFFQTPFQTRSRSPLRTALAIGLSLAASAWPGITPNRLFTSNMVLQHGMAVPVWGTASAGETVTVKIKNQVKTAVAGADGAWKIKLDSLAIGGPFQMGIQGADTVTLDNVMVGEVWLCSGQSNMTIGMGSSHYDTKVEAVGLGNLRLFSQKSDIAGVGPWNVCSPATAERFPATAFWFGRFLADSLKIPIGIIVGAVGATLIEEWMSTQSILDDPDLDTAQVFSGGSDGGFPGGNKGGGLYRNIIAPLIPFSIRGIAWYQGEWNTAGNAHPEKYQGRFAELIRGWRKEWGQGDLPFYFVQLPNFKSTNAWPAIREAQRLTRKSVPNTQMAIAIDLGGGVPGFPDSTELHPRNKKDVGYRLALPALANIYGHAIPAPSGPLFKSLFVRNDTAHLAFDYTGSGLMAKTGVLGGFEIAAVNDTHFVAASASIAGKEVVVWKSGSKVTRVRYAWDSDPDASLYNKEGLPAAPFQTYITDVTGVSKKDIDPDHAAGNPRVLDDTKRFDPAGRLFRIPMGGPFCEGVYYMRPVTQAR